MIKGIIIAHWTNLNQNDSFVNPQWLLPLLCKISETILLALVDLMADRQIIFKCCYNVKISLVLCDQTLPLQSTYEFNTLWRRHANVLVYVARHQ